MGFLTDKISRNKLDKLIAPLASKGVVLEVGSYGKPDYGKYFPNRKGIDIRPGPGVDIVASVYELPFVDNSFDTVLCISVLEHLTEPSRAVVEMQRVLKPGGTIIISVPFLFPIHESPNDYWRFTKYGLQHLFVNGWKIEKLIAETNEQEAFAVLLQRFGYQTRLSFNSIFKVIIFSMARFITLIPRVTKQMYGDIRKKQPEPEAFASSFFLVARKQ